jgi:tetratricopeptide (TPR) repeat protein
MKLRRSSSSLRIFGSTPSRFDFVLAAAAPLRPRLSLRSLTRSLTLALALSVATGFTTTSSLAAPDLHDQAIEAQRADELGRAWELALAALDADGRARPWEANRLVVEIARDSGRLGTAEAALHKRGLDHAAAHWALGLVHLWRNEFDKAVPRFERSQALAPGRLEPYLGLADCHLALEDRSLDWLDELRGRLGHHWAELSVRALVLDATAHTSEAVALYREAARFQPSHPELPHRLAIAQTRIGEHSDAEENLDRAARLVQQRIEGGVRPSTAARGLAAIEITRGEIAFTTARFAQALDALELAQAHAVEAVDRATLARALILEGRVRAQGLDPGAARRPLRQALRLARRIGDDQSERAALEAFAELELAQFQTSSASARLTDALARSVDSGDARGIERTLALLGMTSLARGEYLEALTYFQDAAARARQSGDFVVQQQAIEGIGRAQLLLSNHWRAIELARDALSLARQIDFKAGICRSHLTAGRADYQLGRYTEAQDHLQRAADLAGKSGLARLGGRAHLYLGQVAEILGEAEMAQAWFRRALDLARRAHDPALETDGVSAIGEGFLELGAYDQALRQYERALAMATETGYLEGRLENLTRAAEALKLLGDTRRSIALVREGLRLSKGLHNRVSQAKNYLHLGEIFSGLGDFRRSLSFLDRSLGMNRETGSVVGEGDCLLAICRTYNQAGSFGPAVERCNQALSFAEKHGNDAQRARASIEIGNGYLGSGQPERAEPYFRASHQLAESLDHPGLRWPAAYGMARVLAAQGKTEPAIQMSREAVATLERLRSELALPEMRAGFLEGKFEPYEQLILLLVRQGNLAEAFRTMEYSRSRTFLEILTDVPGGDDGDRIADLRRKNLAMRREILRRTEDLAALPASADRDSATTAVLRILHELRRRHDELQAEIGRELPESGMRPGSPPGSSS